MDFSKMILIRYLFLLFVFAWSNFSLAMQNNGNGENNISEQSDNNNEPKSGQSDGNGWGAGQVDAEEEERQEEEMRAYQLERYHDNEKLRADHSIKRLLSLSSAVAYGNTFYVRSIRQLGGWICGHFVLFHAWFLEQQIPNIAVINNQTLIRGMLNPQNYNYDAFRYFYLNHSRYAYDEQKNVDDEDFLNGLPCCPHEGRWLEGDQLKCIVRNIGLCNFYILNNYNEQVNIIASKHPALDRLDPKNGERLSDLIEECGGPVRYLCSLGDRLIETGDSWMVHFACFVGRNHWVLISVVNKTGDLNNTAIIIFDSLNVSIKADSEVRQYINFLQYIFCKSRIASWVENLFGWWG